MQNDLKYQVRSREISDLLSMMRGGRLVISPYFQRNLVWRESHKHDFIDTILKGLPFPQIFLARGNLNLDTMEAATCVVDGQQRLNSIREFVANKFPVNGKSFSELNQREKTEFLKYEVPVIDFDLDAGDVRLKDVFQRLNRTYYSLSTIERIATEYSSSEFLLVARVLCGDIPVGDVAIEEADALLHQDDSELAEFDQNQNDPNEFVRDPGITQEGWGWLQSMSSNRFSKLIANGKVFSPYEFQRKVPLMFALNLLATLLGGYYNRNAKVKSYLEQYTSELPPRDDIVRRLELVADTINKFELADSSMWWNKANFFTLVVELFFSTTVGSIDVEITKKNMTMFESNIPDDYSLAAREGVNNKLERSKRADYVSSMIALEAAQAAV